MQAFFSIFSAAAPCNIKCERTNTTSNDGCKFYRIYFFVSQKAVKCKRNGGEMWCGSTDT